MTNQAQLSLKIVDPGVDPSAPNFSPSSWPPRPDSPVTLDESKKVLSRYADPVWDITHHCQQVYRLHFRDAPGNPRSKVTPENGALYRLCLAWWWWGPHAVSKARELEARFRALRPIFEICSASNVTADRFHRFPKLIAIYKKRLKSSQARTAIRLLHDIFEAREEIGFFLMTREQIAELYREMPAHTKIQTPYIPPRIWQHLANRTHEVITEFLAHSDDFASLYWANVEVRTGKVPTGSTRAEDYASVARSMDRWLLDHRAERRPVNRISAYASLVSLCCHVQIVMYSLMRVDEAWRLPRDCFITERDSVGELICSVRGDSTKTVSDPDARWIVAESTSIAISVAGKIADLRLRAGQATGLLGTEADSSKAPLFPRSYEPWGGASGKRSAHILAVRPPTQELKRELCRYKILDEDELIITDEDMRISRLLNPMANPITISVGKPWSFAWHQLRRTGAVNMHSSGLVSDASIQYQLKHASVAMSRYYGRGHYLLSSNLNKMAKEEYVRTMYEMLAHDFAKLREETFLSPYGNEHKTRILNLSSLQDHRTLLREAKKGAISYREHLLGGCANPSPCDKGGFESVAACGGNGKPCEWLLYDKRKLPKYKQLLRDIKDRQKNAVLGEPLHEALDGQAKDVRAAINACKV